MAESESVIGLIHQNLITTLDGITIPYNGSDHIAKAEYQRTEDYFNQSPYIAVGFSGTVKMESSSRTTRRKAKFEVFCYVNDINDQYNPDLSEANQKKAITEVLKNMPSYIEKELLKDITRAANASLTEVGDIDQFFIPTQGNESVSFVTYLEVFVQYYVDQFDPFARVG